MAVDADRWRRIEAVLEQALEAQPGERARILDGLCADDLTLRAEIESLLVAHDVAGDFLETSAASYFVAQVSQPVRRRPYAGTIVGGYRLLEEIGRGGMGTVWLAEAADGVTEHRVALKLIGRSVTGEEILARFRREREILARLEHPCVARFIDWGITDESRPYFVMEHIAAEPITRYCDARRLSISERLRLFGAVCGAVEYVHQSLVIHRDLKPSNVLVTAAGAVKLLDFGISKLLEDDDAFVSRPDHRPMTIEYASPEQIAGEVVTVASDVYQLGIVLYELLAGRRPLSTQQIVTGGRDVRSPSIAVLHDETIVHRDGTKETIAPDDVSHRRGTTPQRLSARLEGDLDRIVLTALQASAERRYRSARALAEDIERHLTGAGASGN